MFLAIVGVLVVLWLLGFIGNVGGGMIHLILVIAGIIFIYQLIVGRRST